MFLQISLIRETEVSWFSHRQPRLSGVCFGGWIAFVQWDTQLAWPRVLIKNTKQTKKPRTRQRRQAARLPAYPHSRPGARLPAHPHSEAPARLKSRGLLHPEPSGNPTMSEVPPPPRFCGLLVYNKMRLQHILITKGITQKPPSLQNRSPTPPSPPPYAPSPLCLLTPTRIEQRGRGHRGKAEDGERGYGGVTKGDRPWGIETPVKSLWKNSLEENFLWASSPCLTLQYSSKRNKRNRSFFLVLHLPIQFL